MWVTLYQSRASVVDVYRQAWALADATLDALPLDAVGAEPWWPADDSALTLHHALVRVVSDTQRHAGHADIVRELIDGAVGMNEDNASLPTDERVEDAARSAEVAVER